ncbi:hypothetical protein ALI144C_19720 [Actinosynnema sp. ALI-1.44]|uniref:hypothetical protein n=1 Tax=Actinosynnema sp. ALI-1.44 TaxID=1933779 RepID=UPI00097CBE6D|nr:hypothetical protein [Actinosynnema sp. ALI-1.44]ONI81545.1 hypothetical protein ALI144C_19720 [Actinosynnema sp. ALI-1.44]
MNNSLPLISAAVSVAGALVTAVLGAVFEHRRQRGQRVQERNHLASRYSHPLLRAASALHNRVGWFLRQIQDERTPVIRHADQRDTDYARYDTLFRFACYLGWVEVMLQEVHFLDLGSRRRNHKLAVLLVGVQDALSRDDPDLGPVFRTRGGEQRAIGELMVVRDEREDTRTRCLGYVTFRSKLDDEPTFACWFAPVLADIDKALAQPLEAKARMHKVHAALSALIDFLDPHHVLLPFSHNPLTPDR